MVLLIVQNPTSITIARPSRSRRNGGHDLELLDGKERVTTASTMVTKRTGSGSADKKRITLVRALSMGSRVFTTEDVYALSEDGKVLTIQSTGL